MSAPYGSIYLDSDDRNNKPNTESTEVTFNVNFRANASRLIALAAYDFVVDFDNINSSNNTAYIDNGATTYVVTLDIGKYSRVQLNSELLIKLNALGLGAWTITISGGNFKFVAPVPIKFITNPINPTGRDWADMLTIKKDTALSQFHNGGVADLTYTNKLYITSPELCNFKNMGDEATNNGINHCLGVVYVNENANYGSEFIDPSPLTIYAHHATRELHNLKWIAHKSNTDVGRISINLYDDRGNRIPVEQQNKVRWSIEIFVRD